MSDDPSDDTAVDPDGSVVRLDRVAEHGPDAGILILTLPVVIIRGASSGVFTTTETGQATLDFYTDNSDVQTENPAAAGSGDRLVASLDLVAPYEGSLTVLSRTGTTYLIAVLNEDAPGSSSTTTTTG